MTSGSRNGAPPASQAVPSRTRVTRILGAQSDPALHQALHHLAHHGEIDLVQIAAEDLPRRRFRTTSAAGRAVEIALPRSETLFDGAILWLDDQAALVLQVEIQRWLRLAPRSAADALALGYQAGNLHWRVRFDQDALLVALAGPPEDYLARLGDLAAPGRMDRQIIGDAA